MTEKTKLYARIAASLLITFLLVTFLARYVNIDNLLQTLSHVRWPWLVAALLLYFIHQWLRVTRLNIFDGVRLNTPRTIMTMLVQSPINATLPAGLGEAALIGMLKKFHGLDWRLGTGSLISTRFADLGVFVAFFLAAVVFSTNLVPEKIYPFMLGLSALLLGSLGGIFILARWRKRHKDKGHPILSHIDPILAHLVSVKNPRIFIPLFGITLVMWVFMYFMNVAIIKALGFHIPLLTLLWIYIIPTDLLPIKGIANLGTYEAVWFSLLLFFDYTADDAATIAFGSHILIFAIRMTGGAIGLLGMAALKTAPRESRI